MTLAMQLFFFVGIARAAPDAMNQATIAANTWLERHAWKQVNGQSAYQLLINSMFDGENYTYTIWLLGPEEELSL